MLVVVYVRLTPVFAVEVVVRAVAVFDSRVVVGVAVLRRQVVPTANWLIGLRAVVGHVDVVVLVVQRSVRMTLERLRVLLAAEELAAHEREYGQSNRYQPSLLLQRHAFSPPIPRT